MFKRWAWGRYGFLEVDADSVYSLLHRVDSVKRNTNWCDQMSMLGQLWVLLSSTQGFLVFYENLSWSRQWLVCLEQEIKDFQCLVSLPSLLDVAVRLAWSLVRWLIRV